MSIRDFRRGPSRVVSVLLTTVAAVLLSSCSRDNSQVSVPGVEGATKTAAVLRADRRLFDGAPPVIPHQPMGADCTRCHTREGISVPGVGYAPPSPHERTAGMSEGSRCEQCHVFRVAETVFVENEFRGLRQDLRHGARLNPIAAPVIPHKTFMRENCVACHSGPAAREEIRTPHPERQRCRQCHVSQVTTAEFARN